jgi:hypothetical protein
MSGTVMLRRGRMKLATRLGWLVGVDARGRLLVDFARNRRGPRFATLAAPGTGAEWRQAAAEKRAVLLLIAPIARGGVTVVGLLRDSVEEPGFAASGPLRLEAKGEMILRCGRATITLREDGKVVIQGLDVLSRASRTNKLKGGSVQIN